MMLTPLPSSIPPPLNPHNRRVDDCIAGEEEVLIEGVEVEVEAEEVAEDVGVGQKKYEEPGPHGSAADFLLGEEMEGDPSGREEVEAAAIKINDSNKCQCLSSSIVSTTAVNDE